MSREIVVAWVGRRRPRWDDLCSHYADRIGKVSKVRDVLVKPSTGPDSVRIEREGEALLAALPKRSFIVAMDRRGKASSSAEFSAKLRRIREQSPHPVAFVVGSDLGLSHSFLQASEWRFSLGPMTLPHELARLVIYEQIYRALAIQQGIKYHRVPLDGH